MLVYPLIPFYLLNTNEVVSILRINIQNLKGRLFHHLPLFCWTYLDLNDRLSACAILRSIKGELVDARKMRCSTVYPRTDIIANCRSKAVESSNHKRKRNIQEKTESFSSVVFTVSSPSFSISCVDRKVLSTERRKSKREIQIGSHIDCMWQLWGRGWGSRTGRQQTNGGPLLLYFLYGTRYA
jgi:hypothetical protein